jgi:hypothetical protein
MPKSRFAFAAAAANAASAPASAAAAGGQQVSLDALFASAPGSQTPRSPPPPRVTAAPSAVNKLKSLKTAVKAASPSPTAVVGQDNHAQDMLKSVYEMILQQAIFVCSDGSVTRINTNRAANLHHQPMSTQA